MSAATPRLSETPLVHPRGQRRDRAGAVVTRDVAPYMVVGGRRRGC